MNLDQGVEEGIRRSFVLWSIAGCKAGVDRTIVRKDANREKPAGTPEYKIRTIGRSEPPEKTQEEVWN